MVKLTRKITLSQAVQKALITLDYGPSIDNSIVEFDDNIAQTMRRELTIVDELQDIIEGNQPQRLFMVFQPIFDTNTQKVTSVEALARFNSFTLGSVNPNEFIEIAEKHHLIYELGKIIFKQSLDFVAQLKSMGNDSIRVAVNVSGIQLVHDHFVEDVLSMLNEFGLNGHHCEIEITESVLMQDLQRVNGILEQLQSHGIVISIDDFGTGYSSFFTLSELNVNILKINRSFVRQIYHAENDHKIIARETIQMAHKLGLKIVAEEVEYEKEYWYLLLNRCDYIQGYYYSRPLIPKQCVDFLNNQKKI
jgi:EAL domain-containing protein (putative c-di-GMP-specific phosphodiesterase class I)